MSPAELKEEYQLRYHVDCLERADKAGLLRGRRILEVGGALPEGLVLGHYGASAWTAVDYRSAYSSQFAGVNVGARATVLQDGSPPALDGQYLSYDGDASSLPASFDREFDVVVSLATFEHIGDLGGALRRMRAALRPGGVLVAQVGPIWSGYRGHHIFPGHLKELGADKTDDLLDHVVPWQHLLMLPTEMGVWLTPRYGQEFADAAVEWIYGSSRLNRLFYDEYFRLFQEGGFTAAGLQVNGGRVPVGWEHALGPALAARQPGQTHFEVDSFWITLEPTSSAPQP